MLDTFVDSGQFLKLASTFAACTLAAAVSKETEWVEKGLSALDDDDSDDLPDLSHLTPAEQYHLACVKTMKFFNRLVHLTSAQRRLYLPPCAEEIP